MSSEINVLLKRMVNVVPAIVRKRIDSSCGNLLSFVKLYFHVIIETFETPVFFDV